MDAVPILDAGGLSALNHFLEAKLNTGSFVIIADLQFQPLKNIAKAGLTPIEQKRVFTPTLAEAISVAGSKVIEDNATAH